MKHNFIVIACISFIGLLISCNNNTYNLSDYGIKPDKGNNMSPLFAKAIQEIKAKHKENEPIVIHLSEGRYDFYPQESTIREYYISNHDQDNPKSVGIALENMKNIIFDGKGADLIFHGQMIPISLINSKNCTLRNFHIDFENPHISQVKVKENDTIEGNITFEVAPWVQYAIKDSIFMVKGEGWELVPNSGIAFEEKTKRVVYRTSDIHVGTRKVTEIGERLIKSFGWKDKRLVPGTVIALRNYDRPTPGIFMSNVLNTTLENIQIHYAQGMGLLAQASENITLDKFSVCLRGEDDPRYFTTQADATHFSGCKGMIISKNGLYEGMMDDAINVHGTYLKIIKQIDARTVEARYMHSQTYGFQWGGIGDSVQFVNSKTMELVGKKNKITDITTIDKSNFKGAKDYRITFAETLDESINENNSFGIENLEWTPEVIFSNNIIRHNRARGSLFSTPRPTLVENNLFDHTSGTAILLCGDCNGWYETGACKNVIIRNNKFINALTNEFQFTNAIISIYPEIPNLDNQQKFFHNGIVIENNYFDTFDTPIVYAKSVDGLIFRGNSIKHNTDYPAFHWNKHPFYFQRVINYIIEDNIFDNPFDFNKDARIE